MAETNAQVAKQLARRVRELRGARGLTLAALAARAGVSKGMLVQIEQSVVNPSLGVLVRIADALGVSLVSLLDQGDAARVQLFEAKDQRVYWRGKRGSAAVLLGGADQPAAVECWRWTIAPGDDYTSHAHPAGTSEIILVLRGTLTVELEERAVTVRAGSCVAFGADLAHRYRNVAKRGVVEIVMFVVGSSQPVTGAPPRPRKRRKV